MSFSGAISNSIVQIVMYMAHSPLESGNQVIISELSHGYESQCGIQDNKCIFECKPPTLSTPEPDSSNANGRDRIHIHPTDSAMRYRCQVVNSMGWGNPCGLTPMGFMGMGVGLLFLTHM